MKDNIRSKIRRFLQSEDGRVSVKAPLTLGIATGSILLAEVMLPSAVEAALKCENDNDCSVEIGEICYFWPEFHGSGLTIEWHSECVIPDE